MDGFFVAKFKVEKRTKVAEINAGVDTVTGTAADTTEDKGKIEGGKQKRTKTKGHTGHTRHKGSPTK
ncbi:hypothetical protein PISMIDRAFT_10895 [Pisolithus microcarpus 441]|uniref:Uncharacterized protein n=1 Tax=Pisolithus microcarpus 441 TaxID=765257 RepID=A0A0C9Z2X2_9AGAM|nr:hypothetical protein PISMIDRAFT_10895 [Pisolithus microcarpus 441]